MNFTDRATARTLRNFSLILEGSMEQPVIRCGRCTYIVAPAATTPRRCPNPLCGTRWRFCTTTYRIDADFVAQAEAFAEQFPHLGFYKMNEDGHLEHLTLRHLR